METKTRIDPIVEEVRASRDALFRETNYDLRELHARILRSQKRHGSRLVGKKQLHSKTSRIS